MSAGPNGMTLCVVLGGGGGGRSRPTGPGFYTAAHPMAHHGTTLRNVPAIGLGGGSELPTIVNIDVGPRLCRNRLCVPCVRAYVVHAQEVVAKRGTRQGLASASVGARPLAVASASQVVGASRARDRCRRFRDRRGSSGSPQDERQGSAHRPGVAPARWTARCGRWPPDQLDRRRRRSWRRTRAHPAEWRRRARSGLALPDGRCGGFLTARRGRLEPERP